MPQKRKLETFDSVTNECLGTLEYEVDFYGHPICPKCGKVMEYWEGQIDQDFMGNDINGWNHQCHACMIDTAVMEGSGGYDHDYGDYA